MTKFPVIYFEETPIIEYLKLYGHGHNSKDYELAISIWIKGLYEKNSKSKSPYCVAFELKEELNKTNPKLDPMNIDHVKDIIENRRKQDTPLDFILVKGNVSSNPKTGWGFQLKRFGKNIKQNFEQELVNYVNKLLQKTQPGEAGLIVIPEADENLQPVEIKELKDIGLKTKKISQQLKTDGNSYKLIKFLSNVGSKILLTELCQNNIL
ncbi:hypothetical protein HY214_01665 [Candidatus Roizmanbacteria bacterium]|nr:hypothetical protein [Candidatus Roizmanbacteria bacterium]